MLRILLLGGFSITHESTPIEGINAPRLQSFLTYLILHSDTPQNRAHLAFVFWPDTSEKQARTNLRNLLYQLRHTLPNVDAFLEVNTHTVQWRPDAAYGLDVDDFFDAIRQGEIAIQQSDGNLAQEALMKAIDIYHGYLLPSCYDDWIMPFREKLYQAYLTGLGRLVTILEEQREYASAIHFAQQLLQNDPLQEETYRQLIRLNALNDNRVGALRAYHVCETVLQRELNVKPSQATREAYERLLGEEGKPSLIPSTTAISPVVGREGEWAQMLQAWWSVMKGQGPQLLLLCGEAGIGKTRLLDEMVQWATRQGLVNLRTNCYAAEGQLAYTPVITWLRSQPLTAIEDVWLAEIARLLPEVLIQRQDLPKPGPLTEEWQRERLFEALARSIVGSCQPLLLTIDDLQWCDRDTLEWLHFLLRYDRSARFLILGAYRPEEIPIDHPLQSLLGTITAAGWVTEINLFPLDEIETHTLASLLTGEELAQEMAEFLFCETEGNPLFIVEMVRAGVLDHLPPKNEPAITSPLASKPDVASIPLKVQSILMARINQLSPEALSLAWLAATIGQEFSFPLLLAASGRDEDTLINQLDELWQRRIVREQGIDAYDFSHDKLREVAYQTMSRGRRRMLHRQVAQALEAIHVSNLAPVSHQIAVHYERAGLTERAVPFYLIAAENARKVYANRDAKSLIQRGLAILATLDELDQQNNQLTERLWEALGDLLVLSANCDEALEAYHHAQNYATTLGLIDQARIYRKIAQTLREKRLYQETLEACQQAESLLGGGPSEDIGRWWDEWIDVQIEKVWTYYWLAQWQALEALVDRINLVVKVRASAVSRMRFLMASCLMNLRKYRYVVSEEMLTNSQESFTISRECGSQQNQIECLFELGFLHLWRRELNQAERHLQSSFELAENTGNVLFQTLCLTYLAVLNRFRGQVEAVCDYTRQMEQAAESAHMPDYVAAAKANQAWLSWRRGDNAAVDSLGQEALAIWQESPLVYPFQWQVLWPLLGVSLKQGQLDETIKYVRALLELTQQRLPDPFNDLLEKALPWFEAGDIAEGIACLNQAVEVAREVGYL